METIRTLSIAYKMSQARPEEESFLISHHVVVLLHHKRRGLISPDVHFCYMDLQIRYTHDGRAKRIVLQAVGRDSAGIGRALLWL